MNALIHDLSASALAALELDTGDHAMLCADGRSAPCQGCFDCWLKYAGRCRLNDPLRHVGSLLGRAGTVTILCRLVYGCYAPEVKAVLDRSISTQLPLFTYRGGMTHHCNRYPRRQLLRVFFYGESTEEERRCARRLAEANAVNMGFERSEVRFLDTLEEMRGMRL